MEEDAVELLKLISKKDNRSQGQQVEHMVRERAKELDIKPTDSID